MGITQYRLGKKHGSDGVRTLAHRQGRRYDSAHGNESYLRGYYDGAKERMSRGKVGLDYTQPLNNQLFGE